MGNSKWNGALTGGFFWAGDPNIQKFSRGFVSPLYRPRWWQIMAWYRVVRVWLGMSHDITTQFGDPLEAPQSNNPAMSPSDHL